MDTLTAVLLGIGALVIVVELTMIAALARHLARLSLQVQLLLGAPRGRTVGEPIENARVRDDRHAETTLFNQLNGDVAAFLLVDPSCPVCGDVLNGLESLEKSDRDRLSVITPGDVAPLGGDPSTAAILYDFAGEASTALGVQQTPWVSVINHDRIVLAQGPVRTAVGIEQLLRESEERTDEYSQVASG